MSLGVRGGSPDQQAHAVDVASVHQAAQRYREQARAILGCAETLRSIREAIVVERCRAAGAPDVVARTLGARLPWMEAQLSHLADAVAKNAEDRLHLADRAVSAAVLFHDGDRASAGALDRLLDAGVLPIAAYDLRARDRSGVCSLSPPSPDSSSGALPSCPVTIPRQRAEDFYTPQRLSIESSHPIPARRGPGLQGLLQTVHDGYAATTRTGEEADTIDVQERVFTDAGGVRRHSYVVSLPGTSRWNLLDRDIGPHEYRSMRPNLEGADGVPSAEARLIPDVLRRAGVPDGADVLLVGHSQGGMTAMSAAALPAMARYRVQVVTAGSPVGRIPSPPYVSALHLQNRGDVVPAADGVAPRPYPRQVSVVTGTFRAPLAAHDVGNYVRAAEEIDEAERGKTLDPRVEMRLRSLEDAGHIGVPGDHDEVVHATRYVIRSDRTQAGDSTSTEPTQGARTG